MIEHNRTSSLQSNVNSTISNRPMTMKSTLSYQIESALKEYESLQNKLSSLKGQSYSNHPQSALTSKPETPNALKTPLTSKAVHLQPSQREETTPSRNVMSEFKSILLETEHLIANKPQRQPPQQRPSLTPSSQLKPNPIKTESDIISISNKVLNKTNLDLKNLSRVLEMELKSYKSTSSPIPMSQYEGSVNVFLDLLKTSLNTSQMSNKELNEIHSTLKEDIARLEADNVQAKDEMAKLQTENDEVLLKNKDVSAVNALLISKCGEVDNENKRLIKEIEKYQQKVEAQEVRIGNLNKVNQSYCALQFNNEEILNELKATIGNLKERNEESARTKEDNSKQLSFIKNELKSKEDDVKELKEKLRQVVDRQNELKELEKSIADQVSAQDNEIMNNDLTLKAITNDTEKLKANSKVLLQVIEDREKTITSLNETINFLSTSIKPSPSTQIKSTEDPNASSRRKVLNDLLAELAEKESQLNEIKSNYEEILKLKDQKISLLAQQKESLSGQAESHH